MKEKLFDRELNVTYKHHMQTRPLYCTGDSELVDEQAEKISLKVKMQLEPDKVDDETGLMAAKAKMFTDSFLDDPQSYAYLKMSRETRQNHYDLS